MTGLHWQQAAMSRMGFPVNFLTVLTASCYDDSSSDYCATRHWRGDIKGSWVPAASDSSAPASTPEVHEIKVRYSRLQRHQSNDASHLRLSRGYHTLCSPKMTIWRQYSGKEINIRTLNYCHSLMPHSRKWLWLAWSHGGGITGTCGRPVLQQISKSGWIWVRRPAAAEAAARGTVRGIVHRQTNAVHRQT